MIEIAPDKIDEFVDEGERFLWENSLYDYAREAFKIVEPGTEFNDGKHIRAICEYLEAVTRREIRNLLITMPPRHMKSLAVSVFWPTWVWLKNPEIRWIFASYASELSIRDSVKCRRILESDWYRSNWGHMFTMASDQNVKSRFENDKRGFRYSTSVGGAVVGEGGDFVVVDDPHNLKEIFSKVKRHGVIEWWDQIMATRLNDPARSCRVAVMQRGHMNDLIGHCLEKGGYIHLNLPGICETRTVIQMPITKIEWIREEGDILWPNRYPKEELDKLKKNMGSVGFATQIQQRPSPAGGNIWKRSWFQYFKGERPPVETMCLQSWDTAFKEEVDNDYSVCTTWILCRNAFYLMDVWRERVAFPELSRQAEALYYKWHPNQVLIEDKASGQSLVQHLQKNTIIPIFPIKVDQNKVARANAVSPSIEAGKVFLPESARWLSDFLDECENFPAVEHDDQVDSVSQALSKLIGLDKRPTPNIRRF